MPSVWSQVHPLMPDISVDVSWTTNPSATPVWASVTSRLRQYEARLYRQTELDEFQTGEFSVVLDNSDRELEPGYASSALYPNVIPHRKIRVQARTRPALAWSTAAAFTATRSPAVTVPAGGYLKDDVLIAAFYTESTFTFTTSAFWQLGDDQVGSGSDCQAAWQYVYAGSDWGGGTITFTNVFAAVASGQTAFLVYRGADVAALIHKKAEVASGAAATTVSGPSVTPTIDGCTIVQIVGCDPTGTGYAGTPDTSPVGTERIDNVDASQNSYVFVQDYQQPTAAAIALDVTGLTADAYVGFQIAIAPRVFDRAGGFIRVLPVSWPSQKDAVVLLQAADYGMALNRAQVTIDGYPEELAHLRIGRVLDTIGVPAADRAIDTATHTCAAIPAQVEGQPAVTVGALEHCRAAALSDGGYLFVSRDGKVTFHNRTHRRDINTTVGTLGDSTLEIPYSPSLVAQMDDARMWNHATVITAGGTREEVSDTASELKFWQSRRDDFQSLLAKAGEAAALASLFVWRYKDERLRFPTVDLALESSHPYMNVGTCLAADVGTRFNLKRRPSVGGAAISQDVHVEGIRESVIPGMWKLSFDVGPADVATSFWVLQTSALNSTAIVGY